MPTNIAEDGVVDVMLEVVAVEVTTLDGDVAGSGKSGDTKVGASTGIELELESASDVEGAGTVVFEWSSCFLRSFDFHSRGSSCVRAGAASALVYCPLIDMTAKAAAHAAV